MQVELISIGDELLIGQTINTNAAWMGTELAKAGFDVLRSIAISDTKDAITTTLDNCLCRVDIVLITGGLGPTQDDITKQVLAAYFGMKLVRNDDVYKHIEQFFASRGRTMLETNARQADLPDGCTLLHNPIGTAAGMWFEKNNKIVVSLPGVPYEMKIVMSSEVLPRLGKQFAVETLEYTTVLTQGIGESYLADIISDWETRLRQDQLSLAYLPSPGIVRLRISGKGGDKVEIRKKIKRYSDELIALIPNYFYGYENDTLQEIIGKLLLEKKATVSTAESCTGGYIAHQITSVAGSSNYYVGSVISYSNAIKIKELGVDAKVLEQHGAVSQQVVEQMAKGILSRYTTDYAIAVSGVAGPDGGSAEKPVGTVWIAVADKNNVYSKQFLFEKDRQRNIVRTSLSALMLLRRLMLGQLEKV